MFLLEKKTYQILIKIQSLYLAYIVQLMISMIKDVTEMG